MEKYPEYKHTKKYWGMEIIIYSIIGIAWIFDKYQLGNSDIAIYLLIIFVLIIVAIRYYLGRFKEITINDYFVILQTDEYFPHKIPILWITSVYTCKVGKFETSSSKVEKYWVDVFAKTKINIHLKNRKAYHIIIKNAEQIKEEIEKRMLNLNVNR